MDHAFWINKCFELARRGFGHTAPNPMVGCVLVRNNNCIAEGFHQKFGAPHAEVVALTQIPASENLADCILYVNLEPCSHYGKTPPCANLIIQRGIKQVVISNSDPNPLVSGKGIQLLKDAGINVVTGVLEEEGAELNKRFFTFHMKHRPYIILKWAQTSDDFVSKLPVPELRSENIISGADSLKLLHQWRSEEQAILVGTKTVMKDNPQLTVRLVDGKNPVRVVFDREGVLGFDAEVFNSESRTFLFTARARDFPDHVKVFLVKFDSDFLTQVMEVLYHEEIQSVIVEGGVKTLNAFIKQNLWDEVRIIISPRKFLNGLKAPVFSLEGSLPVRSGEDTIYFKRNKLVNVH